MTTTSTKRRRTRKQRKGQTDRTKRRKLFFFERESWPRRRIRSFVSLLSWRDLRRVAARDKKTPLESARIGFKSNNNNTFLIIVSSIASPHPKVVRYSSHRAGRIERERERLYLRLREKTNGFVDKIFFFIVFLTSSSKWHHRRRRLEGGSNRIPRDRRWTHLRTTTPEKKKKKKMRRFVLLSGRPKTRTKTL